MHHHMINRFDSWETIIGPIKCLVKYYSF